MNKLIDGLHALVSSFVSVFTLSLSGQALLIGLCLVSIVVGVIFLLLYGRVSNQGKIRDCKRAINAAFLEAILFRHDLRASLHAQGAMFLGGLRYFSLATPPLLILLLPSLFILAQLNLRYGLRPLRTAEPAIVSLRLEDASQLFNLSLESDSGGIDVTPPLRKQSEQEILWRVTPTTPGDKRLSVKLGDQQIISTELRVVGTRSPTVEAYGEQRWWSKILYPGTLLKTAGQQVRQAWISYPEQKLQIFGMHLHWIVVFCVVSILAGLVASRVLHIEI